jgi:Fe-S oxidoreductase/nitrate reductase gamma subunit
MIPIIRHNLIYIAFQELLIHYSEMIAVIILYILWLRMMFKKFDLTISMAWKYTKQNFWNMVKRLLVFAFLQKKFIKNKYAAIMHYFISYGLLFLTISTALVFLDNDILTPFHIRILVGNFYIAFMLWSDTAGVVFLIGLFMALYRRIRKKVLLETTWANDYVVLLGFLLIAFEGFFLEGLNIYLSGFWFNEYRYIGTLFAKIYLAIGLSHSEGVLIYQALWFAHFTTVFIGLAYLPFSKLSHIILSPSYVSTTKDKPRGEMSTPFLLEEVLAKGTFDMKFGLKNNKELNTYKRLESAACTNCGRCERACPAFAAGRDLSPRLFVQNLKGHIGEDREVVPLSISENAVWSCTTCQACVEECPVLIDPQSFILEIRRSLVLESKIDKEKINLLNNLTYTKNPLGNTPSDRNYLLSKADKYSPDKEYLYWVGCLPSLDPRARATAEALIELLKKANVSFGILGEEEHCCGDPARRLGEEGRYQELALENIATFKNYGVKKVIVSCAHGFNTIKNEYKKFGFDGEVYHHTEIINKLIAEGKLDLNKGSDIVTYHDPCYLGRINGKYNDSRNILNKTAELTEMSRSRENSFCCGGGGSNYWYKVTEKEPISQLRLKEAINTGSNTIAVACPYCLTMLEDAARTMGMDEKIKVKDISEIVLKNIKK